MDQIWQLEALFDGQPSAEDEHSKTLSSRFSAHSIIFFIVKFSGSSFSAKPPFAPLNDFKIPSFARFCKILAKKLFEILSSFEIVSTSTGDDFWDIKISESRAYSLAFVKSHYSIKFLLQYSLIFKKRRFI